MARASIDQEANGNGGIQEQDSPKTADQRQWNFPKNTLEDAIRVAQAIEEKYAGNPVQADQLLKPLGFHKTNDWRFKSLLRSASLYGLTSGSGTKATVALDQIGRDVVAPKGPEQRRDALLRAFRNVQLFAKVLDYYSDKRIPEEEFFANTLIREFDVPRDRVETFTRVFTTNAVFLKAFKAGEDGKQVLGRFVAGLDASKAAPNETAEAAHQTTTKPGEAGREFLDTCFIIMPFGEWYDRYYRDIYVPAARDAGYEPVRADQLFNTGSVIEQIWEQISKAKVLLAELTGKNANVFYELGLAHAIPKPVVFVSGNLEDVPFDLRHLRMIIYDIRDPEWGAKLRQAISVYLKNAKSDPARSIPQPFRDMQDEDDRSEAELDEVEEAAS